jgi:hypothetical protein
MSTNLIHLFRAKARILFSYLKPAALKCRVMEQEKYTRHELS